MSEYIWTKYIEFYEKNGYIPQYFVPYNTQEVKDYCCTLSTRCGSPGGISNLLVVEKNESIHD